MPHKGTIERTFGELEDPWVGGVNCRLFIIFVFILPCPLVVGQSFTNVPKFWLQLVVLERHVLDEILTALADHLTILLSANRFIFFDLRPEVEQMPGDQMFPEGFSTPFGLTFLRKLFISV